MRTRPLLVRVGVLVGCAWLLVRLRLAFFLFRTSRRLWPLGMLLLTREECRELAPRMACHAPPRKGRP